jgi:RNA polymerase sigma-70 factor (ECF subfamily)
MVEQGTGGGRVAEACLQAALVDAEPALMRLGERLCASHADTLDLLQDTFERAMRQGMPVSVRSPRAWLATIMHNLFVDRCRAAARRPRCEVLDEEHGDVLPLEAQPPEPAWSRITVEDIRVALDEIDPAFRDVYVSYTFDRRSYEQIADQLSIQRVTVGTRLTRARKKLRDILGKRFGVETVP